MAALPPLGAAAATKPVQWPCHVSITINGSWGGRPVDSYRGVAVLSGALIDEDLADTLELRKFKLHKRIPIALALSDNNANDEQLFFSHYINLCLISRDQAYVSTTVCHDHADRSVIDKCCNYNLLSPPPLKPKPAPKLKLKDKICETLKDCKAMQVELNAVCAVRRVNAQEHLRKSNRLMSSWQCGITLSIGPN
ncbi:hypothetical protein K438DRAFT_1763833 [Mycena galopus ATCC 62051]|nr:hypothetical protein K438DRAFT_1763833 [Mycena galopus ATCC 62051]